MRRSVAIALIAAFVVAACGGGTSAPAATAAAVNVPDTVHLAASLGLARRSPIDSHREVIWRRRPSV